MVPLVFPNAEYRDYREIVHAVAGATRIAQRYKDKAIHNYIILLSPKDFGCYKAIAREP